MTFHGGHEKVKKTRVYVILLIEFNIGDTLLHVKILHELWCVFRAYNLK